MADPNEINAFSKFIDREVEQALERAMARDIAGENKYPSPWYDPIDGPVRCPGSYDRPE